MMNQEEYVDVHALKIEGWTAVEIADETGFHPATISKWLKQGPPVKVEMPDERRVMTAAWRARIETLLGAYPRLLAVSVHNKLGAEGFEGSYPTVVRAVRDVRGPRFRPRRRCRCRSTPTRARRPSSTSVISTMAPAVGLGPPLRCFGMILCWSRWRMWWFTTSEDQQHTFEGLARFFEAVGGVPAAARTDRMGALGRRRAAGSSCTRRRSRSPPTTA